MIADVKTLPRFKHDSFLIGKVLDDDDVVVTTGDDCLVLMLWLCI